MIYFIMMKYWYGDFNNDNEPFIIMDDKLHINENERKNSFIDENDDENSNSVIKIMMNNVNINDTIYISMVYSYAYGELLHIGFNDRDSFIDEFVEMMFNAITEYVCDNDNNEHFDLDNNDEYYHYLASHNLEMCYNKYSLKKYLIDPKISYLVLDVDGHLTPSVIIIKKLTVEL
jgi:hypothetical protein